MGVDDGWRDFTAADAARWIAVPGASDDKYRRGVLGVRTGSDEYPGAAVLGVEGAARAGVGMIRYLGPSRARDAVLARRPEAVAQEGRVQAWLLGSGMDPARRSARLDGELREALASGLPAAVDAGVLDLAGEGTGPVVVTPHHRELVGLLAVHGVGATVEEVAANPGDWAVRAAEATGLVVLLKGAATHVAAPGGARLRVALATPWLATAGAGDVLGGILGALLATHHAELAADASVLAPLAATAAAVHGLAAREASRGGPIVALDVAEAVPRVIAGLVADRR
ncbi:hypothetical protein ARHIZOSPH14_02740 [Agromyces rhizosphaerae]|uniref:ADP-dependent (S)-NAD(P)H-hydrate dehydratase n=1 Tax=Agromyces rhizosphaerae TaxID=88374 RepID=A0A9W6CVJ9_9MICO|nr:ADP/ATP-dependent (S)-NAD(P)H-hydrate dehydratase [Agromyces rhizosphaerae]GLI26032.1 hypothetical protein ARHIZOSPH14_02740 [Agromyces rhizosphaerae]